MGWGRNDKIRLTDVSVVTLHYGKMTNSRRTSPVPQLKCVGGTAGCSAFTPSVVQCYNRGSDGYDVQVNIALVPLPRQIRCGSDRAVLPHK